MGCHPTALAFYANLTSWKSWQLRHLLLTTSNENTRNLQRYTRGLGFSRGGGNIKSKRKMFVFLNYYIPTFIFRGYSYEEGVDIFEEALAELAAKERVTSSPDHPVDTLLAGKPEDIMSDSTSTLIGSEATSCLSEDKATYSVEGTNPVKLLEGSYQAKYIVEKPVNQAAAGSSGLTQKTRWRRKMWRQSVSQRIPLQRVSEMSWRQSKVTSACLCLE